MKFKRTFVQLLNVVANKVFIFYFYERAYIFVHMKSIGRNHEFLVEPE